MKDSSQNPVVSVVILDYEKSHRVLENVASLAKQKFAEDFEVVVAVNAATPEKRERLAPLEKYDFVRTIFFEENLGYPRGINRAVEQSRGEFLAIVNPDIVWHDESALQKMTDFLRSNEKVGVVGPRQINDDSGETAMTVRAFPQLFLQIARRTFLRRISGIRERVAVDEMRHLDYKKTQPVDWLQSSCWIVRRDLWQKLNGLDENYFIFMSDPDFCWRVWEAGSEVIYFPDATVGADGVRASAGGFFDFFKKWTIRQHLRDAWIYRKKFSSRENPRKKL